MPLSYRLHTYTHAQPPQAGEGLRLAIWQGSGTAATTEAVRDNLERLEAVAPLAAAQGAHLLAFPELYLSGYIVTPELARRLAEPVDGPSLQRVAATARRHGLAIACPYPERAWVAGPVRSRWCPVAQLPQDASVGAR
jgi:5-aminopentanamidase